MPSLVRHRDTSSRSDSSEPTAPFRPMSGRRWRRYVRALLRWQRCMRWEAWSLGCARPGAARYWLRCYRGIRRQVHPSRDERTLVCSVPVDRVCTRFSDSRGMCEGSQPVEFPARWSGIAGVGLMSRPLTPSKMKPPSVACLLTNSQRIDATQRGEPTNRCNARSLHGCCGVDPAEISEKVSA